MVGKGSGSHCEAEMADDGRLGEGGMGRWQV